MAHRLATYFASVPAEDADEVCDRDMTEADQDEFARLVNDSRDLSDDEFAEVLGTTPAAVANIRRFSWGR